MPVYTFEIAPFLAGRSVTVRDKAGSTVASGTLDQNAKFTASLGVGDYVASASDGNYTYRASGVVDQGDPDRLAETTLGTTLVRPESRVPLNPVATAKRGGMPRIVSLVTGSDDEVPTVTNATLSVDTTNWKVGGRAHKITSTGAAGMNLILDPIPPVTTSTAPLNVPAAQAVCMWVYIPDVSLISDLKLFLYQDDALTTANQWDWFYATDNWAGVTGQSLVTGWNFIRIPADHKNQLTNWNTLFRVTLIAQTTAATSVTVGHIYLECPEKARILMITDRGYKTWLDNIYPDLKARNIPVTVAVDCTLAGSQPGTAFEAITEAQIDALSKENGNSISFHGYDGSPTTSMTAAQLRTDTVKALKWLQARGYAGRMWRAAYVQDSAPQWAAASDYLIGSADGSGNTAGLIAWPPTANRYRMKRLGLMNNLAGGTATIDKWFADLKLTHMTALIYTHGMDPSYQYDVSQEMWDYFMAKWDAAVAEGWIEAVTFEQLFFESGGSFSQMGGAAVASWTEPDGTRVTKNIL